MLPLEAGGGQRIRQEYRYYTKSPAQESLCDVSEEWLRKTRTRTAWETKSDLAGIDTIQTHCHSHWTSATINNKQIKNNNWVVLNIQLNSLKRTEPQLLLSIVITFGPEELITNFWNLVH